MAASAAALWSVNGAVSKVILASGISSFRLSEVRMTGALAGFVLVLLAIAPERLRVRRDELPFLVVWGIGGLVSVQLFYFLAIHRLAIGIALLIEYVAPLLVAIWARFVFHEHVRRRIWLALVFALVGLALIVDVGRGGTISTAGLVFAFCSPSTVSATATPSRCSRGDSRSAPSSGASSARGGASRRHVSARTSRCSGTSPAGTCRCGR
jgi:drug/metabolite transporter (DMT)-like permease